MVLEENGEDKIVRESTVTNEQVLDCIGEKRSLLNNILRKKKKPMRWSYLKIKSLAYSSRGSHNGKLDFCN